MRVRLYMGLYSLKLECTHTHILPEVIFVENGPTKNYSSWQLALRHRHRAGSFKSSQGKEGERITPPKLPYFVLLLLSGQARLGPRLTPFSSLPIAYVLKGKRYLCFPFFFYLISKFLFF